MIISCPQCSTGYLLPEHLMGPGGARVRCPRCQHLFAVGPDGVPRPPAAATAVETPPERHIEVEEESAPEPAPAPAPASEEPLAVAQAVLTELATRSGAALEHARAEHRLFAEFGPALMEAYEAYRRRAGKEAGAGPFRAALRERWGVDLVPLQASESRPGVPRP